MMADDVSVEIMNDHLFRFKAFSLRQEYAAMRITTDGVLLGAWVRCGDTRSILDVGAGTGLIALMLAQRCHAPVVALEPDPPSFEDLLYNVAHSPWPGWIIPVRKTLQEFGGAGREGEKFGLIVSNPPWFAGDRLPSDQGKRTSRHALTLTHEALTGLSASLLAPEGRFCLILPRRYEEAVIGIAAAHRLFCNRLLHVRPRKGKAFHRVLMEFGTKKQPLQTEELTIHSGRDYTEAYKALTRDFYPAF